MANLNNAKIDSAAGGDLSIVAAATGKTCKVYALQLSCGTTGTVQVKDGAGGTALTGVETLTAGIPLVLPFSGIPWYIMTTGNAFVLATSAVQFSGNVLYELT